MENNENNLKEYAEKLEKQGVNLMQDYILTRKVLKEVIINTAEDFKKNKLKFLQEINNLMKRHGLPGFDFEEEDGK